MAKNALFFNSVSHDRVYNAESFGEWLKPFFTTGVFDGDFEVSADGGMSVEVAAGYAHIDGKVFTSSAAETLTIDSAHATLNRIDNICIRRDDGERTIDFVVEKGTNSSTPVAPTPTRSGGIYDLVIAQVYVAAASVSIAQADITDTRDDDTLCGIVIGTVSSTAEEIRTLLGNMYTKTEADARYALQSALGDQIEITTSGDTFYINHI